MINEQLSKLEKVVSHWLKQFRTTLNLSTSEVAELTGIDRDRVEDLENGVKPASVAEIEVCSEAFYTKPSAFFASVEDNNVTDYHKETPFPKPQKTKAAPDPIYIPQKAEKVKKRSYNLSRFVATQKRIVKQIGKELRAAREKLGMTQLEASQKAGIDYSYLNQLENGRTRVTDRLISRIAAGYAFTLRKLSPTFHEELNRNNSAKLSQPKKSEKQINSSKLIKSGAKLEKQIRNEIRETRKRLGLSLEKAAERAKLHFTWFSKVETGVLPISDTTIKHLEKAFKLPGKKIAPSYYSRTVNNATTFPKLLKLKRNIKKRTPAKVSKSVKSLKPERIVQPITEKNTEKPNIDWLRYYRIEKKLTQKQVGEALGVSGANYNLMESGSIGVKPSHLEKLKDLYGVEISEFFRNDAAPTQNITRVKKAYLAINEIKSAWLRYHRNTRHLQQLDVATAINIDPGTYSRMENGKGPIYDRHVEALTNYYKIPVSELFKPEAPPQIFRAGEEVFKRYDRRDVIIGRRIEKLRKRFNYKQSQVASLAKMSEGTYAGIASGRIRPNDEQLRILANIFHVSKKDLERPDKLGNFLKGPINW